MNATASVNGNQVNHQSAGTVPPAGKGRDGSGKFAKGNPGGPGNPFARKTAALRSCLIDFVSVEDMREIAADLVRRAKGGDNVAVKLLFAYVLGKPGDVVNPKRDKGDAAVFLYRGRPRKQQTDARNGG